MEPTVFLVREISNRMRRVLGNAEQCLGQLEEGQVWYRAHPRDNAIGNLILHIAGSFRAVHGLIDGQPVSRNRAAEFSATQGKSKDELTSILHETIEEFCRVIESVPSTRISEVKRIQDFETTMANILVGAVSHLSVHVGQMQFIAKSLLQEAYKESSAR
ncbi:MAG: DUF1572 family protein [Spirochaetia bacterium]